MYISDNYGSCCAIHTLHDLFVADVKDIPKMKTGVNAMEDRDMDDFISQDVWDDSDPDDDNESGISQEEALDFETDESYRGDMDDDGLDDPDEEDEDDLFIDDFEEVKEAWDDDDFDVADFPI